jgi:hypothetical protein
MYPTPGIMRTLENRSGASTNSNYVSCVDMHRTSKPIIKKMSGLDKNLLPIVVVGRRGVGKSAFCKNIAQSEEVFKDSISRNGTTKEVTYQVKPPYIIFDTPGFAEYDTHETKDLLETLNMCAYFGGIAKIYFIEKADNGFDFDVLCIWLDLFGELTFGYYNRKMWTFKDRTELVFTHTDNTNLTIPERKILSGLTNKIHVLDTKKDTFLVNETTKKFVDYFPNYTFCKTTNKKTNIDKYVIGFKGICENHDYFQSVQKKKSCTIM